MGFLWETLLNLQPVAGANPAKSSVGRPNPFRSQLGLERMSRCTSSVSFTRSTTVRRGTGSNNSSNARFAAGYGPFRTSASPPTRLRPLLSRSPKTKFFPVVLFISTGSVLRYRPWRIAPTFHGNTSESSRLPSFGPEAAVKIEPIISTLYGWFLP